jgi:hypothetical protein
MNTRKYPGFKRWSFLHGVGLAAVLGVPTAVAQTPAVDEASGEEIEEVVVTGSRIKRDSTFTSTSPLAVIDAAQQAQFGAAGISSAGGAGAQATGFGTLPLAMTAVVARALADDRVA